MSSPLRGLYAITDSQLLAEGRLLPYVEAALKGGARLLQYRDKSDDQARRLREASALAELCARHGAELIINDDAELAARLGVSVHLGQTDGSLAVARALLGRQAIIGATCHAQLELAEQAVAEGASYVAFGRFFNSSTKPGAPAASVELLDQARLMATWLREQPQGWLAGHHLMKAVRWRAFASTVRLIFLSSRTWPVCRSAS